MKKFLFFSVVLSICILFASCDDGSELRTYQIHNKCSEPSNKIDHYLNGSLYEVEVHFYNDNDKVIEVHQYDKIGKGERTDITDAPTGTVNAKVSFKFLPPESQYYYIEENDRVYTAFQTKLKKGKNTVIELEDKTSIDYSLFNPTIDNIDFLEIESIFLRKEKFIIK